MKELSKDVEKNYNDDEFIDYINLTPAGAIGEIVKEIMSKCSLEKINYSILKKEIGLSHKKQQYEVLLSCNDKEKLQELLESFNVDRYYNYASSDHFMYTCESKFSDVLKDVIDISVYEMWMRDMDNSDARKKFMQELIRIQNLKKEIESAQNKEKHIFSLQEIELYFEKLINDYNTLNKIDCRILKKIKENDSRRYGDYLKESIFTMTYNTTEELEQALNTFNELYDNFIYTNIKENEADFCDSYMSKYKCINTGEKFETFLMELFEQLGYKCKHTGGTNDQGADLIINKNGKKTCVQAKFYSSQKLGNTPVQEVAAAVNYYKADNGIVVTNYEFTKGAYDLAKANNVKLIDGKELEKLIKKVDDIESIEF